jgi:hypothetical protein
VEWRGELVVESPPSSSVRKDIDAHSPLSVEGGRFIKLVIVWAELFGDEEESGSEGRFFDKAFCLLDNSLEEAMLGNIVLDWAGEDDVKGLSALGDSPSIKNGDLMSSSSYSPGAIASSNSPDFEVKPACSGLGAEGEDDEEGEESRGEESLLLGFEIDLCIDPVLFLASGLICDVPR